MKKGLVFEYADEDDERRRKLLRTLSLGTLIVATAFMGLIFTIFPGATDMRAAGLHQIYLAGIASIFACGLTLGFSKVARMPARVTANIFLATMLAIIVLATDDTGKQYGSDLVVWGALIVLSAVLVRPKAAFVWAGLESLVLLGTSLLQGYPPHIVQWFEFQILALACWMGANSIESALRTARKEAQQNNAILKAISDGVVVLSSGGEVISKNPAAENLASDNLLDILRQGKLDSGGVEIDGRTISVSASEISQLGVVYVLRDETRRAELDRAKDALLATTSHELRTPLSAIIGFADILQLIPADQKVKDLATRISLAGKRLKNMVNSLLDHAQLQAGALHLAPVNVALAQIASDITLLMSDMAKEKGLSFAVEITTGAPDAITTDPDRLQQVLVNLVGNAIKFSDKGGVRLRLAATDENHWSIAVSDSGDGIPTEQLPDIFEPFRRGSDYATRRRQGAGLGLAITKQIVEKMGGTISVTSKVGQGSTFTIQLPRSI